MPELPENIVQRSFIIRVFFQQCSASCGGGIRTRSVQCIETNNNLISDDRCPEHSRPRNQEKCNETPCAVRWVTGEWGEVSDHLMSRRAWLGKSIWLSSVV